MEENYKKHQAGLILRMLVSKTCIKTQVDGHIMLTIIYKNDQYKSHQKSINY